MKAQSQPPHKLVELQTWLRWVITEPYGVKAALMGKSERLEEPRPSCLPRIENRAPLSREERLSIYAEAYFLRLADALADDYSKLYRVLEDTYEGDPFRRLIADYLVTFPSQYSSIGDVGRNLPGFLEKHRFTKEISYLPDLARLEWALIESFYADDLAPLDFAKLTSIAEEDWVKAKVVFDSSARLLKLGWTVHKLFVDECCGEDVESHGPNLADIKETTTFLLILREAHGVDFTEIDPLKWEVLNWLREGRTLGEVCDLLAALPAGESEPPPLMQWFQEWAASGLIREVPV